MVPHDFFISKLKRHGFDGWSIQWIRNWLDECSQRVVINGFVSRWRPAISCVPQGPVLGPVLFNIFISDTDSEVKGTFIMFVDDLKLSSTDDAKEGQDHFHGDLDRLEKWPMRTS